MARASRLFLLSPAKVGGIRVGMLLNPNSGFPLARQFHTSGLPLADIFSFASALYFRGKIAYARHFASPTHGDVIRLITATAGLIEPERVFTPSELGAFGEVDIHVNDPRYHAPLRRDATAYAAELAANGRAILLGSIATPKYRDVLLDTFGERLVFPEEFVGRGDMSRGGLMLRAVRANQELEYIAVRGAVLKGKRPPRLDR